MKIAFLLLHNPSNVKKWSGLNHYILCHLKRAGYQVQAVWYEPLVYRATTRCIQALMWKLLSKKHQWEREPLYLRWCSFVLKRKLRSLDYDVVLSPSTLPLAYLNIGKPMFFWTDACFAAMIDFYFYKSRYYRRALRIGNACEQRAINACKRAIYSSEWAANCAKGYYRIEHEKTAIVPFGGNVDFVPSHSDLETLIQGRIDSTEIRLLFIGVEWERKGGPLVVEVFNLMRSKGLAVRLDIVGASPDLEPCDGLVLHGYISKGEEAGRQELRQLFKSATFFLLPSVAECCALVVSEAAAYGVPSFVSNVGGMSTAVDDNMSGALFDTNCSASVWVDKMIAIRNAASSYKLMAIRARHRYDSILNWESAMVSLRRYMNW